MTLPSKYRRPISFSHLYWILGISAIITALVVALFIHTTGVLSVGTNQKNLKIEPQLLSHEFVYSNGDTLEYLTTGSMFSEFSFHCDNAYWKRWLSPTLYCLKLSYDGKPGIVELYIDRKFPHLSYVNYGPGNWPIPFQLLEVDTNYTKLRIELPSAWAFNWGSNLILITGNEGGLMPFLNPWLPWVVFLGIGTFIGSAFLFVKIRDKF